MANKKKKPKNGKVIINGGQYNQWFVEIIGRDRIRKSLRAGKIKSSPRARRKINS